MVSFMQLPGFRTPNTGWDTEPVSRALAGYNAGHEQVADRNELLDLGRAALSQGPRAAANAAYGQGRIEAGIGFQNRAQDDEDRTSKKLGQLAQAVDLEQDPGRRGRMWTGFLERYKRMTGETGQPDPDELDPMSGPKLFMAKAGIVNDPLEREHKQAQINSLNAKAASGPEDPSNVREWMYFKSLPPEEQQRYITMKRADKWLDTGTAFAAPNPVDPSASPRVIAKDVAGKARQEEIGTAQGKQIAAAPSDIAAADSALDLITSLRSDPNREAGTGISSLQNFIRSTPGYDYQTKVDQATSGAFLTAIQQMRGMGALSNAEGQTATRAVTRLSTAASEAEFLSALNDYETLVKKGKAKAQQILQQGSAQPQAAPPANGGWSIQRVD